MNERQETRLEELRLIQNIIAQQQDLRTRAVAWSVALNTGLIIARFSDTIQLAAWVYLCVALLATALFFWLDTTYKVAEDRAIERSNQIEESIRTDPAATAYDGPKIGLSFIEPNTLSAQFHAANNVRLWGIHAVLLLAILATFFSTRKPWTC